MQEGRPRRTTPRVRARVRPRLLSNLERDLVPEDLSLGHLGKNPDRGLVRPEAPSPASHHHLVVLELQDHEAAVLSAEQGEGPFLRAAGSPELRVPKPASLDLAGIAAGDLD